MPRSTPTPAAGSIAAQLARLNQFRPGSHRVVTCYLKVEPRDRARGKYLIKVKNRVRAKMREMAKLQGDAELFRAEQSKEYGECQKQMQRSKNKQVRRTSLKINEDKSLI